jgi:LPXTG-motif cell wall-anchored protein
LSTYCDNPEGGQTVSILPSALTTSAVRSATVFFSPSSITFVSSSQTTFNPSSQTTFIPSSSTTFFSSSQETPTNHHALSAELRPIPILFSVAGVMLIIIFGVLFRRRKMKRHNTAQEQDPPPYDEAKAGDIEKGSSSKIKDKKQGFVAEYMAKIHDITGDKNAKKDGKYLNAKGESDNDQISFAGSDVYKVESH